MNLDNIKIEIQCPKCKFYNSIFIKQARLRDVIICRGCKSNIQLDDQMNEVRKIVKKFRRQMAELMNSLHDINIKINL